MHDAKVSVVAPSYNDTSTLDATLMSVRCQTHENLEAVVVVDGATDATEEIARRHSAQDPRVRVLVTENGGVAAARNAGAGATTGAFIAPIDADDLWHPDRLRRQLAVFETGGEKMGFVYSPFRVIDMNGDVLFTAPQPNFSGSVFFQIMYFNFVGNGSGLLIRRAAFDEAGGYEPALRAMRMEGAEDRLIQMLIASRWLVGVAPDYLIGYRRHPGAMSSNFDRGMRSSMMALDLVAQRRPKIPVQHLRGARAVILVSLSRLRLRAGDVAGALRAFSEATRTAPGIACIAATTFILDRWRGVKRRFGLEPFVGEPFLACDPALGAQPWPRQPVCRLIRKLEAEDRALFASRLPQPSSIARAGLADPVEPPRSRRAQQRA